MRKRRTKTQRTSDSETQFPFAALAQNSPFHFGCLRQAEARPLSARSGTTPKASLHSPPFLPDNSRGQLCFFAPSSRLPSTSLPDQLLEYLQEAPTAGKDTGLSMHGAL